MRYNVPPLLLLILIGLIGSGYGPLMAQQPDAGLDNASREATSAGDASQKNASLLFEHSEPLQTRMRVSFKNIRTATRDSSFVPTYLSYNTGLSNNTGQENWDSVAVNLQTRGNFRLEECFYPPLKMELPTFPEGKNAPVSTDRNSPFHQVEKLKLVLPCQQGFKKNDYVLKEYLAYRMYELISPYHLKTRLSKMDLYEQKGKGSKLHEILVFFLETNGDMADRYEARRFEQKIQPMQVDTLSAMRNSFFQFMIGNTDYSLKYGHNRNILFIDKEFVVVPFDFDMSGFVNTDYSTVSNADNLKIIPAKVTERSFKGYARSEEMIQKVRQEFLSKEQEITQLIADHQEHFESKQQFDEANNYIESFFHLLKDDKEFEKYFIRLARNP